MEDKRKCPVCGGFYDPGIAWKYNQDECDLCFWSGNYEWHIEKLRKMSVDMRQVMYRPLTVMLLLHEVVRATARRSGKYGSGFLKELFDGMDESLATHYN